VSEPRGAAPPGLRSEGRATREGGASKAPRGEQGTQRRTARVERITKETQVLIELDLDGTGVTEAHTGVPFFDHMLAQLGRHGCIDLTVRTRGDTEIDAHHTVEDTALALGQALREALGDKAGISRWTRPWPRPRWTCPAGRTPCTLSRNRWRP